VSGRYRSLKLGFLLLANVEMAIAPSVVEVATHTLEAQMTLSQQDQAKLSHLQELKHEIEVTERHHPDDGREGPDADDPRGQTTELVVDANTAERGAQERGDPPDHQPEPVEGPEKSTLIGGPEVEVEIAEMQKLLDEQQQARDEQAADIETMKQTFREAHEDDSPEQSAAHEKQLAAAEELAQQALAERQEAERQALQERQLERERE
jgi:hypothetical protein